MWRFAEACERMVATRSRGEKVRILAELLRAYPLEEARVVAVFLGGRPFAATDVRTLDVGGALLWRALGEASGADETALMAAYRRHGDLGAAAHDLLEGHPTQARVTRTPTDLARAFGALAAMRRAADRLTLVREVLATSSPLEAKYLVKIITSGLRIGSKESLVLEAIAAAFGAPREAVVRADMLLGDAGETVRLAAEGRLDAAELRLFHAVAPMLASPAASASEAFERLPGALVEDKYDGIRAQVHVSAGRVRILSRTTDDVTAAFPELVPELARFAGDVVLDGEVVGWSSGRALPFSSLQRRLGRKVPTAAVLREVPVAYVAFDVLQDGAMLLLDRPLRERRAVLARRFEERAASAARPRGQLGLFAEEAPPEAAVLCAPCFEVSSVEDVERCFEAARARGNEGSMLKDPASAYTPGRRGKSWLKLKRELGTLDVVVTAVEYGHGKRAGVLSDYTFAVRDGDALVNIGKAYTGLTDVEIAEMTAFFLAHVAGPPASDERHAHRLSVEPVVVIEVAFNNMMKTKRHASGLALRFPRIVRLRPDKRPEDADTLETARALFARQV